MFGARSCCNCSRARARLSGLNITPAMKALLMLDTPNSRATYSASDICCAAGDAIDAASLRVRQGTDSVEQRFPSVASRHLHATSLGTSCPVGGRSEGGDDGGAGLLAAEASAYVQQQPARAPGRGRRGIGNIGWGCAAGAPDRSRGQTCYCSGLSAEAFQDKSFAVRVVWACMVAVLI